MSLPMARLKVQWGNLTIRRFIQFAFFAMLAIHAALAGPITFTMTATATGNLAGTAFTNAAITVTSVTDTSLVVVSGTSPDLVYDVFPANSSISIDRNCRRQRLSIPRFGGIRTALAILSSVLSPLLVELLFATLVMGFSALPPPLPGLTTYNLESSFGPIFSPFDFETSVFNDFQNIPTTDGILSRGDQ